MDLYYMELSPPSRSVILLAKSLGVKLNLKLINLLEGEHLKPQFLSLNPQHTVPTLVIEKDFVLWESGAILNYLAGKYDKSGKLLPADPKTRALVERLLYFTSGTLYPRYADYFRDALLKTGRPLQHSILEKVHESLGWLDVFISGHTFAAANHLTVADYSLITVVSQMDTFNIDFSKYSNIKAWRKRCEKDIVGYKEVNENGVKIFTDIIKKNLE